MTRVVADLPTDPSPSVRVSQATGIRREQVLVSVFPGLPTAAEVFIVPGDGSGEGKSAHLDQVVHILVVPASDGRYLLWFESLFKFDCLTVLSCKTDLLKNAWFYPTKPFL